MAYVQVLIEARGGRQSPQIWSYISCQLWVPGTELWSFGRAVSALSCSAISPGCLLFRLLTAVLHGLSLVGALLGWEKVRLSLSLYFFVGGGGFKEREREKKEEIQKSRCPHYRHFPATQPSPLESTSHCLATAVGVRTSSPSQPHIPRNKIQTQNMFINTLAI